MTIKFKNFDKQDLDWLLIGNSRLHWAIKRNNSYKFFHTLFDQKLPENIDFKELIWASVGKYQTNKFLKKNEITIKDLSFSNMPQYFGIDRALSCFAAFRMFENKSKKNILIVDLGTTISITKIDNKGNLIGGQLLPGFTTQLNSMADNSKNLKVPDDLFIPINNFEVPTMNAMLRGVYNSITGAIQLAFEPAKDSLILCGGDSNLIGKSLKKEIPDFIIEPNLAIYGMILLAQ